MKNIVFGIFVTLVFLAIVEGVSHLIEPKLDWEIDLPKKSDNVFRVLVFGGSTTAGVPNPEFGFVKQLESGLKRVNADKNVEVINLGKGGENSDYVKKVLEYTINSNPDLIIILTAHNEFLKRLGEHSEIRKDIKLFLDNFASTRILQVLVGKFKTESQEEIRNRIYPEKLSPYDRKNPWFMERIENHKNNLKEIKDISKKLDIPVYLLTGPANLSDWPPVSKYLSWTNANSDYESDLSTLDALINKNNLSQAEKMANTLIEKYGRDAGYVYRMGKIKEQHGNISDAYKLFLEAKDLDPYPWRAITDINQNIRSFSGYGNAGVIDIEYIFRELAEKRVGYDLIGDNVHPTPLGNAIIAREIMLQMQQDGLYIEHSNKLLSSDDLLKAHYQEMGNNKWKDNTASLNMEFGIYLMKTPFYLFEKSREYLLLSLDHQPDNWRVLGNLSTVELFLGNRDKAIGYLDRAIKISQDADKVLSDPNIPYLKIAADKNSFNLEKHLMKRYPE